MGDISGGDYKLLNPDYPVTEVSDADLTAECGTEKSQPPYSPCLSRKTADDLFVSCCQQHVNWLIASKLMNWFKVPSNCHSLCTYEHREQVAAQTLISVVQNSNCDLKVIILDHWWSLCNDQRWHIMYIWKAIRGVEIYFYNFAIKIWVGLICFETTNQIPFLATE